MNKTTGTIFIIWIILYDFTGQYSTFHLFRRDTALHTTLQGVNSKSVTTSSYLLFDLFNQKLAILRSHLTIFSKMISVMRCLAVP